MPRPRGFDLDELLAHWTTGDFATARDVMEHLGIDERHKRSVQLSIRRFVGPRPKRQPARSDKLRRRVIAWMVASGLDDCVCFICGHWTMKTYIRELKQDDDLGTLAFVCYQCKRPGDV